MTPRDWLEDAWHASLLALAVPAVLGYLLRHRWARAAFVGAVLVALAYHVAVVDACYQHGALCYWRT